MRAKMSAVFVDLDGTVYRGVETVPGARRWIARAREAGIPLLFLTNSAMRTPEQVAEKLREAHDIPCGPDDVLTAATATACYLAEIFPGGRVHVIGGNGLRQALRDAGLRVEDTETADGTLPDAVAVGFDPRVDYERIDTAARLVRRGARFVATNPDRTVPTPGGGLRVGNGVILAAITAGSGVEPEVVGKPRSPIFGIASERLGHPPAEETWMVGDNLQTDIRGGLAAGLATALLLSGVTDRAAAEDDLGERLGPRCRIVDAWADLDDLVEL